MTICAGASQIVCLFSSDYVLRREIVIMAKQISDRLWHDRKRWLFFGLPFTFTRYSVNKERFFISKGFLNVKDDEVRLYRIMDISLRRTLFQRIFGLGTIHVCSGDKTMQDFDIINIKKPVETKELLSDLVERQRDAKRVVNRENMIGHMGHDDADFDVMADEAEPFV